MKKRTIGIIILVILLLGILTLYFVGENVKSSGTETVIPTAIIGTYAAANNITNVEAELSSCYPIEDLNEGEVKQCIIDYSLTDEIRNDCLETESKIYETFNQNSISLGMDFLLNSQRYKENFFSPCLDTLANS